MHRSIITTNPAFLAVSAASLFDYSKLHPNDEWLAICCFQTYSLVNYRRNRGWLSENIYDFNCFLNLCRNLQKTIVAFFAKNFSHKRIHGNYAITMFFHVGRNFVARLILISRQSNNSNYSIFVQNFLNFC